MRKHDAHVRSVMERPLCPGTSGSGGCLERAVRWADVCMRTARHTVHTELTRHQKTESACDLHLSQPLTLGIKRVQSLSTGFVKTSVVLYFRLQTLHQKLVQLIKITKSCSTFGMLKSDGMSHVLKRNKRKQYKKKRQRKVKNFLSRSQMYGCSYKRIIIDLAWKAKQAFQL